MWFNLTSHVPTSPKIRASALSRKASRWLSDPMAFRTNLATWKLIPKPLDLQPQDWIKTNSWLNQPIWKMFVKMGENLSQCSGWKLTKNIWVATTYKNDPLKRLLLFFFAFFSAVFMKKNCQLVGVSPNIFLPKLPQKPGICGITVGNLRDLTRGQNYIHRGKNHEVAQISGAPKKDHENSSGCSKKGSLYYWFIIPIPK